MNELIARNKNICLLLKEGFVSKAVSTVGFIEEADRPKMIEVILNKCVKEGRIDYAEWVASLIGHRLSRREFIRILGACVKKGWIDEALTAVGLLGRGLRVKELNCILAKCVESGRFETALKVAGLLERKLNKEELECILIKHNESNRNGRLDTYLAIMGMLNP